VSPDSRGARAAARNFRVKKGQQAIADIHQRDSHTPIACKSEAVSCDTPRTTTIVLGMRSIVKMETDNQRIKLVVKRNYGGDAAWSRWRSESIRPRKVRNRALLAGWRLTVCASSNWPRRKSNSIL